MPTYFLLLVLVFVGKLVSLDRHPKRLLGGDAEARCQMEKLHDIESTRASLDGRKPLLPPTKPIGKCRLSDPPSPPGGRGVAGLGPGTAK